MRVFLTGATGFLGAAIAAELVRRGASVWCLVRPGTKFKRLAPLMHYIHLVEGDLNSLDARHVLEAVRPHAVCHAAWKGVTGAMRNHESQEQNVAITVNLAQASLEAGAGCFLGLGSQAEYGPLNRQARESDPVSPTTLYGAAKVAAGQQAAEICSIGGLRFAWLRIFSLYGPCDNSDWLLPYVINTLLKRQTPALTAGEQRWDFLHVTDAARAVADILEKPNAQGIFNLGSGVAPSLRETIELVRDMINPTMPLEFGKVPYRPDQVMWLQADIGRIRRATGWYPQIELKDGLRQVIESMRATL